MIIIKNVYLKGTIQIKNGFDNHRELEFIVIWELVESESSSSCIDDKKNVVVLKNGCVHTKLSV